LNAFIGGRSGIDNTTGSDNAFLGDASGFNNTTGGANTFLGRLAASNNTQGGENVVVGRGAGASNTTENANTLVGFASNGAGGITNASALGHRSKVSQSNSLVLGSISGINGATESVNVGVGTDTPDFPLQVVKTTPGGNAASIEDGAVQVGRFDGGGANFRFITPSQSWLFQNQPGSGDVFSIRNETDGNSPFQVHPESVGGTMMIRGGRWGLGVGNPAHPIHTNAGGAHLTAGGVWTNASSRSLKTNIDSLSIKEALSVLRALDPVTFEYKAARGDTNVGFIAEDVPELVASAGRQGLSPMDIVAVAVRVLQAKDAEIANSQQLIAALEDRVSALESAD
jgi:hypothetical protein